MLDARLSGANKSEPLASGFFCASAPSIEGEATTLALLGWGTRLKTLGRVQVHENDAEAAALLEKLRVPGEKTPAERAMVIHVEAFDWNCPQHITPRYTVEELAGTLEPLRKRMEALEAENVRLRGLAEQDVAALERALDGK